MLFFYYKKPWERKVVQRKNIMQTLFTKWNIKRWYVPAADKLCQGLTPHCLGASPSNIINQSCQQTKCTYFRNLKNWILQNQENYTAFWSIINVVKAVQIHPMSWFCRGIWWGEFLEDQFHTFTRGSLFPCFKSFIL